MFKLGERIFSLFLPFPFFFFFLIDKTGNHIECIHFFAKEKKTVKTTDSWKNEMMNYLVIFISKIIVMMQRKAASSPDQ